jgi:hypothetical protein
VVDLYVTVQELSFVAAVAVFGLRVHGLPVKTPLSPTACEKSTVPCGGVCVPGVCVSVTTAVHVTVELIAAGFGVQVIVVVVVLFATVRLNPTLSELPA